MKEKPFFRIEIQHPKITILFVFFKIKPRYYSQNDVKKLTFAP